MSFRAVLLALIAMAGAAPTLSAQLRVTPLPRAHAHNDYEHSRPLLDALDQGFCSVEADIWLTPEGLLIAHEKNDLRPERTLQRLYLDPLRKRVQQNGGRVYPNGPSFWLLIDVKTEAVDTYRALDKLLAQYADLVSSTRDGRFEQRAVTIVLSGNRAIDLIRGQAVRYVGIDGRPEDLPSDAPADLMPWISARWGALFDWQGDGPFPSDQQQKLSKYVKTAHQHGRKVRFWATPDKPEFWKELLA